jgi:hypothetical protein
VHEPSDALLIGSGPYFYARRVQLALLAARYGSRPCTPSVNMSKQEDC